MKERLSQPKILIPSGELAKRITPYLAEVGIRTSRADQRSLQFDTNAEVTLVQVRPSDIPAVLSLGLPGVLGGIAGSDSFLEQSGVVNPGIEIPVYKRGERRPRIAVAATQSFVEANGGGATLMDLSGKMITTTLPEMTKRAFEELGMKTTLYPQTIGEKEEENTVTIFPVGGKTEALPLLSDACPAVLDVVDSGDTLTANGLEVIKDIHEVSVRLVIASGLNEENLAIFAQLEKVLAVRKDK
ncbi:MAG: hypothetical protein H0W89_06825 [Candidatus Levybacteria bacterium]|nr:hypothetical protein [Candidatus Levybacteria bacterium]